MDKQNEVLAQTQKQPTNPTLKEAVKYGVATAVVAGSMQMANAAEIDTIGASLSDEITSVKTIVVGLFTLGAVLLGLFAGYRYLKKGANSA